MATRNTGRSRSSRPVSKELLEKAALARKKKAESEKIKWHWSLTLTIVGILGGGMLTIYAYLFTRISLLMLFGGIIFIGFISMLIQWKKFHSPEFIQRVYRFHISIYALYNIGGIGLLLSGILLNINWLFASSSEITERYRILGFDHDYVVDYSGWAVFLLENDAYADDPYKRAMYFTDAIKYKDLPYLEVVYHKGLLGLDVFDNIHLSAATADEKSADETGKTTVDIAKPKEGTSDENNQELGDTLVDETETPLE